MLSSVTLVHKHLPSNALLMWSRGEYDTIISIIQGVPKNLCNSQTEAIRLELIKTVFSFLSLSYAVLHGHNTKGSNKGQKVAKNYSFNRLCYIVVGHLKSHIIWIIIRIWNNMICDRRKWNSQCYFDIRLFLKKFLKIYVFCLNFQVLVRTNSYFLCSSWYIMVIHYI